jgi:5-methyltetrahydrofolate--homocysteine methyltransferase
VIVGLSGFLTLAYDPMKDTVAALKGAGLNDVKVMVGGGQIDDQIRKYTGADAYGCDAMAAVALAKDWT